MWSLTVGDANPATLREAAEDRNILSGLVFSRVCKYRCHSVAYARTKWKASSADTLASVWLIEPILMKAAMLDSAALCHTYAENLC